jgi:hypothetical protein
MLSHGTAADLPHFRIGDYGSPRMEQSKRCIGCEQLHSAYPGLVINECGVLKQQNVQAEPNFPRLTVSLVALPCLLFPFARSARHSMPSDPTSFVSATPAKDRPITAVDSFFSQLLRLAACGVACGKISHLSLDQCPAQSPRLPPLKLQPSLHRPQFCVLPTLNPSTRNPLHPSSPHPYEFFHSSSIHTKIIGCVLVSSVLCHPSRLDQLRGPLATNITAAA